MNYFSWFINQYLPGMINWSIIIRMRAIMLWFVNGQILTVLSVVLHYAWHQIHTENKVNSNPQSRHFNVWYILLCVFLISSFSLLKQPVLRSLRGTDKILAFTQKIYICVWKRWRIHNLCCAISGWKYKHKFKVYFIRINSWGLVTLYALWDLFIDCSGNYFFLLIRFSVGPFGTNCNVMWVEMQKKMNWKILVILSGHNEFCYPVV